MDRASAKLADVCCQTPHTCRWFVEPGPIHAGHGGVGLRRDSNALRGLHLPKTNSAEVCLLMVTRCVALRLSLRRGGAGRELGRSAWISPCAGVGRAR